MGLDSSWIRRIKSSSLRHVIMLISGASLAQVIPFIFSPILSRIYLPENFGVLSGFTAIAGLFSSVGLMQLDKALVVEREGAVKVDLAILSIFVLMLIVLLSFILFSTSAGEQIVASYQIVGLEVVWFLPMFVLLSGAGTLGQSMLLSSANYKALAGSQVMRSVSVSVGKVGFGWRGAQDFGLVYGLMVGLSTQVLFLIYVVELKRVISQYKFDLKRIMHTFQSNLDFVKYASPQGLLDAIGLAFTLAVLNHFVPLYEVGLYTFVIGLVHKPIMLVANQVGVVYFKRIADFQSLGKSVENYTRRIFFTLLLVISISVFPVIILRDELFRLFFGESWSQAGLMFNMMVPLLISKFTMSPFSSIPKVFGHQRTFLLISIGFNFIPPLLLGSFLLTEAFDVYDAVFVMSLTMSFFYLLLYSWYMMLLKG